MVNTSRPLIIIDKTPGEFDATISGRSYPDLKPSYIDQSSVENFYISHTILLEISGVIGIVIISTGQAHSFLYPINGNHLDLFSF